MFVNRALIFFIKRLEQFKHSEQSWKTMADLIDTLPLIDDGVKAEEYSRLVPLLSKDPSRRHQASAEINKKKLLFHVLVFFFLSLDNVNTFIHSVIPRTKDNPVLLSLVKTTLFGLILFASNDKLKQ